MGGDGGSRGRLGGWGGGRGEGKRGGGEYLSRGRRAPAAAGGGGVSGCLSRPGPTALSSSQGVLANKEQVHHATVYVHVSSATPSERAKFTNEFTVNKELNSPTGVN